MDRPKALALSVSLTGVIGGRHRRPGLNFGLVGAAAPNPTPTAAVAGARTTGSAADHSGHHLRTPARRPMTTMTTSPTTTGPTTGVDGGLTFSFGGGDDD